MAMNPAFLVSNGLAPIGNPRALPLVLKVGATTSQVPVNLTLEEDVGLFDNVQTIYVDNADNTAPLILKFGITGQRIICPAQAQGYFAVCSPDTNFTAQSAGSVDVAVILFNVPLPGHVWSVV